MSNYLFLLLVLACPLMMMWMMRGHGHGGAHGHAVSGDHQRSYEAPPSLDELRRQREELDEQIEEREAVGGYPERV